MRIADGDVELLGISEVASVIVVLLGFLVTLSNEVQVVFAQVKSDFASVLEDLIDSFLVLWVRTELHQLLTMFLQI